MYIFTNSPYILILFALHGEMFKRSIPSFKASIPTHKWEQEITKKSGLNQQKLFLFIRRRKHDLTGYAFHRISLRQYFGCSRAPHRQKETFRGITNVYSRKCWFWIFEFWFCLFILVSYMQFNTQMKHTQHHTHFCKAQSNNSGRLHIFRIILYVLAWEILSSLELDNNFDAKFYTIIGYFNSQVFRIYRKITDFHIIKNLVSA